MAYDHDWIDRFTETIFGWHEEEGYGHVDVAGLRKNNPNADVACNPIGMRRNRAKRKRCADAVQG